MTLPKVSRQQGPLRGRLAFLGSSRSPARCPSSSVGPAEPRASASQAEGYLVGEGNHESDVLSCPQETTEAHSAVSLRAGAQVTEAKLISDDWGKL